MSKKVGLSLAVAAVAVLLAGSALAAVPNDVTGNGSVDVSDVQCTVLTTLNPGKPPSCLASPTAADLNCDKTTDVVDVQLIVLVVLKFPANGVPADKDKNGNNIVDACESGAPVCPNGLCESGETPASCPADCGTGTYLPGDAVITEIMKDPRVSNDINGEWFEVRVLAANGIDFSGWTLRDDGGEQHVIVATAKFPIGTMVVMGINGDLTVNGGVDLDYEYTGFNLDNTADEVVLVAPDGTIVDQVAYNTTTFPDIPGRSLSLTTSAVDATSNDNGTNWCPGTILYGNGDWGNPGMMNPTCPAAPVCGNSQITAWEQCDDGNTVAGDGCDSKCQAENPCGNGVVDAAKGETCDDGNMLDGDGCSSFCTLESLCPNGKCDPGETCTTCESDCGKCQTICGNYIVEGTEQCDSGPNGGPCCTSGCIKKSCGCTCGDGIKECGEQCDDGNKVNGDGCSSECVSEKPINVCGNGVVEPDNDEQCDDGNTVAGDGCDPWCHVEPVCCTPSPCCCDKFKDPGEECDDGNDVSGDGCDKFCKIEAVSYGFKGTVTSNVVLTGSDKLMVFGFKTAVADCNAMPQGQTSTLCMKDYVTPTFPLQYQCNASATGNAYPVAAIDKGGDGIPDMCAIYTPVPVTIVQNQWVEPINFDILQTGGMLTGTITCTTCNPVAADSLSIMVATNAPPYNQTNQPKMVTQTKVKPVTFPYTYKLEGVKAGAAYIYLRFDKGDNNGQGAPGPGDKEAWYPGPGTTKAATTVTIVNDQTTTANISF